MRILPSLRAHSRQHDAVLCASSDAFVLFLVGPPPFVPPPFPPPLPPTSPVLFITGLNPKLVLKGNSRTLFNGAPDCGSNPSL